MQRIADGFAETLEDFNLAILEESPDTVFAVDASLRLVYLNPAWFAFARENYGEPDISERFGLGRRIDESISGILKTFYRELYLYVRDTAQVITHDYECSSPDQCRLYHQSLYPLHGRNGILAVNSLRKEETHHCDPCVCSADPAASYEDGDGLITQCSHCRRIRRPDQEVAIWDWVPDLVRQVPDNTSHGLCPVCFNYYYNFISSYRGLRERVAPRQDDVFH